jgi:hypothetical protein
MASRTEYMTYRPLTNTAKANALAVSVYYSKGGINYFNYTTEPRGYYASVNPVTIAGPSTPGGFSSVSYGLFTNNGFKVFLKGTERMSGKTLKALAQQVLGRSADLAAAFDRGEPNAAHDILAGFKDPATTMEVA